MENTGGGGEGGIEKGREGWGSISVIRRVMKMMKSQ